MRNFKCNAMMREICAMMRAFLNQARKDVAESNIGTQTSIAESASQRRSTDIAIHLRQPPSIHAISQDPPFIYTVSQEENSAVVHSKTEHCELEFVCDEVNGNSRLVKKDADSDIAADNNIVLKRYDSSPNLELEELERLELEERLQQQVQNITETLKSGKFGSRYKAGLTG
ncbi:hypothetical protein Tco_1095843 [Tanacetum coccineum]